MTDNAFERPAGVNPNNTDVPLFEDGKEIPLFEQIQRALPDDGIDDSVEKALSEMPPNDAQAQGIKQNIDKLKQQGLWATARFYERLLEAREAQEG
jgi:hypothetical protein